MRSRVPGCTAKVVRVFGDDEPATSEVTGAGTSPLFSYKYITSPGVMGNLRRPDPTPNDLFWRLD
jgi:hypothetical protein